MFLNFTATMLTSQMFVSNTRFSVVGQGNGFLELRSVGFPWQENQKGEKEQ
jgi:hypothetical protein